MIKKTVLQKIKEIDTRISYMNLLIHEQLVKVNRLDKHIKGNLLISILIAISPFYIASALPFSIALFLIYRKKKETQEMFFYNIFNMMDKKDRKSIIKKSYS